MSIQNKLAEAHRVGSMALGDLCLIVVTSRGKRKNIEEIVEGLKKTQAILTEALEEMDRIKSKSKQ